MLKIKKALPYIIALIVALGLPMAIWEKMPSEKKHTSIVRDSGRRDLGIEITDIEQSFKAQDNNLSSVALFVQPLPKGNKSIISVKLLDSDGKLYAHKQINIAKAKPRPLLKVDFPVIENSLNREFTMQISNIVSLSSDKSALNPSDKVKLYTNNTNEYKEGVLKKEGILEERDIALNTYYAKTKMELLDYLFSQLPLSKPVFLIIFGLFVWVLFLFIKESLKILE